VLEEEELNKVNNVASSMNQIRRRALVKVNAEATEVVSLLVRSIDYGDTLTYLDNSEDVEEDLVVLGVLNGLKDDEYCRIKDPENWVDDEDMELDDI
jgi:hypothetical protein